MARTAQQIIEQQIGALTVQIANMASQLETAQELNEYLRSRVVPDSAAPASECKPSLYAVPDAPSEPTGG